MKIEVYFTPFGLEEQNLSERVVVVIDVLRASSSMIAALQNGAKEIIPVLTVADAQQVATGGLGNDFSKDHPLLCGERLGKMIDGFDLGNSPGEFTQERVKGKSLVFSTTNGTKALLAAKGARALAIAGFNNISIVKEFILKPEYADCHLVIVCAGRDDRFALEDTICAGLLIDKLIADKRQINFLLTDTAGASRVLYEKYRGNELSALKDSEHGKYLTSIGFSADIAHAARIDSSQALPIFEEGVLKLMKLETKKFKRVS
ncbi:MAG: 2-phosphosulfolactate phosphatase [Chloroherpetonaceae bacterium]|nr:2-phosphosulfolactate phosphatase [Chloroherpetonaceae bacterium]